MEVRVDGKYHVAAMHHAPMDGCNPNGRRLFVGQCGDHFLEDLRCQRHYTGVASLEYIWRGSVSEGLAARPMDLCRLNNRELRQVQFIYCSCFR